jgi:hypothetical protein
MTRASVLKRVNPILGILLINQIVTGLLRGALSYKVYEVMHERAGIVFAIVALLHVALNWNWIRANFFRKPLTARKHPVSGKSN